MTTSAPQDGQSPPPIVAPEVPTHPTGVRLGRSRRPLAAWALTMVTLGVYGVIWYYRVNRELRDYNGRIKVSPVKALCAVTVLAPLTLLICPVVSIAATGGRVDAGLRYARAGHCSRTAGVLLMLLLGFGVCYYQSRLNRIWAAHGQVG